MEVTPELLEYIKALEERITFLESIAAHLLPN